jgi:hypothetical protein
MAPLLQGAVLVYALWIVSAAAKAPMSFGYPGLQLLACRRFGTG